MTLQAVKDNFLDSITESRDLFTHCLHPAGLHTESGVEAAFLQLHKNWEVFLEEILICLLNNQTVLSGAGIVPKFTVNNRDLIRDILYQDKNYIEWTDEVQIRKRFERHLHTPNRILSTLATISVDLKDITKIRNFIAHSSGMARTHYVNMVRARIGGNPDISRASRYLLMTNVSNPPQTIFEMYMEVIEVASEQMIG